MLNLVRSFRWNQVTTQSIVRVLISSYFIALSVGIFPGTDVSVLLDGFLAGWLSTFLTHLAVFTLAVMILLGVQRRAAALLLGIMVFWASYMALMSLQSAELLGSFWRDLALVGALILTYADSDGGYESPGPELYAAISRDGGLVGADGRQRSRTIGLIRRISHPRSRQRNEVEEQFRKDLSAARPS